MQALRIGITDLLLQRRYSPVLRCQANGYRLSLSALSNPSTAVNFIGTVFKRGGKAAEGSVKHRPHQHC